MLSIDFENPAAIAVIVSPLLLAGWLLLMVVLGSRVIVKRPTKPTTTNVQKDEHE